MAFFGCSFGFEKKCPARTDRASPLTIRNQDLYKSVLIYSFSWVVRQCKITFITIKKEILLVQRRRFIGKDVVKFYEFV